MIDDSDDRDDDTKTIKQALKAAPKESAKTILIHFMKWLEPRWPAFWGCFRPDGTMLWRDFKDFVDDGGPIGKQYQLGIWKGDTRRVFDALCDDGREFITTCRCLEARRMAACSKDTCEWGLPGLMKLFTRKFGCLVAAWRLAFDPDSTGRCSKATFLRQVRTHGFHGSLNTTWSQVTDGQTQRVIHLSDLDPEADHLLHRFSDVLIKKFGSLREGWHKIFECAHGATVHIEMFLEIVKSLGLHHKQGRKLFTYMDPHYLGLINIEEMAEEHLKFLSLWDPSIHRPEASGGSPTSPRSFNGSPQSTKPRYASVDDTTVVGIDAPALSFEFSVVLNKEEYNEYLRRRRHCRLTPNQVLQDSIRQNVRQAPVASFSSAPGSPPMTPGSTTPRSPRLRTGETVSLVRMSFSPRTSVGDEGYRAGRSSPRSEGTGFPASSPHKSLGGMLHMTNPEYVRESQESPSLRSFPK